MAKIIRKGQRIFGSTAGVNQIAQYGSLANSTPNFTTDPTVIQALSQYLDGWFDAVIGGNSPAIEDMNALCYLFAYQLAYLMQEGIAEWDATTTYFKGSIAQDGSGTEFLSLADNNLNNALAVADWFPVGTVGPLNQTVGNVTMPASQRVVSPSPITLAASSVMNVPSTSIVIVPESLTVPVGASLVVAVGGSVRVI